VEQVIRTVEIYVFGNMTKHRFWKGVFWEAELHELMNVFSGS